MIPIIISAIESPEDRDLMTAFYEKYNALMYKEARKHLSVNEDVEDIVYEALSKIIEKMDVFRGLLPAQRVQYAITTTRNLSYIHLKRNNHFTFVSYDAVNFDTLADNQLLPEASVEKKQTYAHYNSVWECMEVDDRMLLEQKYVLRWSDAELAQKLGIKPASIRMRLTRAKRRMMEALIEQEISLADWNFE